MLLTFFFGEDIEAADPKPELDIETVVDYYSITNQHQKAIKVIQSESFIEELDPEEVMTVINQYYQVYRGPRISNL